MEWCCGRCEIFVRFMNVNGLRRLVRIYGMSLLIYIMESTSMSVRRLETLEC